ncbi:MAG: hypothetical protein M0Z51_14425 [Propionibacterium sp.]|nr:hypothetical protein [Propionibacterium sp.]
MAGIASTLLVGLFLILAASGVHLATVLERTLLRTLSLKSGWAPRAHALSRFHLRW